MNVLPKHSPSKEKVPNHLFGCLLIILGDKIMRKINVISAALLLLAGNASATNIAIEKAQPVNTVELTSQVHEDVKSSMKAMVTAFEAIKIQPTIMLKTAKKSTDSELLAKNVMVSE